MNSFSVVLLSLLLSNEGMCVCRLKKELSWTEVDYRFPSEEERLLAIESKEFILGNAIITGIERYQDKLFLSTPRLKPGVPSTLNYVEITENMTQSPLLIPYPSWEMNRQTSGMNTLRMTSVYSIIVDPCERLWALDTGVSEELDKKQYDSPPTLFIYNLKDGNLLKRHPIKDGNYHSESRFVNFVVDVTSSSCEHAYAYLADTRSALVVYSLKADAEYRVNHNYFRLDPFWGNMKTSDRQVHQVSEGVFSLTLSSPRKNDSRDVYFHPLVGVNEFKVSTEILKNKTVATQMTQLYQVVGNRGADMQSSGSFMDQEVGVLFYAAVAKNSLACWNSYVDHSISPSNQGLITEFPPGAFPYDIKVDRNGTLWVLTNNYLDFIYGVPISGETNTIYSGPVRKIIKNTVCEEI